LQIQYCLSTCISHEANRLGTLPGEIGDLARLKSLDVTENPNLTAIPKEICKVRTLEILQLDSHMMSFPPKEIAAGSIEEIMKFMCQGMKK
jgi:E3 ubiquitin-protein ligase LRSAM1